MSPVPAQLLRHTVEVDAAFCRFNSRRSTDPRPAALEERTVGAAVAFRDRSRADSFYYNRILIPPPGDLGPLRTLIGWYADATLPCGIEIPAPVLGPARREQLATLGFAPVDAAVFHHQALSAGPGAATAAPRSAPSGTGTTGATDAAEAPRGHVDVRIRSAGPGDLDVVLDLIEAGFRAAPAPPEQRTRYRDAQLDPAFPIVLLEEDGRAVAMATSFLHSGVAWLGNAYTLPGHRGRGHQLALLGHRLRDAARRGCTDALADVEAGTASQRNCERAGMARAWETQRWSNGAGSTAREP